jgi:ribosomal protein S18 acetylase RimI-like enzyme
MPDNLNFRSATVADLPQIVEMLADDFLGKQRERFESPLPESYLRAFEEIDRDENNELVVVEQNGEIVGTLQLTFIPSISFQGGKRAQIESVRVAASARGQGIGKKMFEWAIERAHEKNCRMIQLSTNNDRADAQRFYENLGFKASHVGMKLYL